VLHARLRVHGVRLHLVLCHVGVHEAHDIGADGRRENRGQRGLADGRAAGGGVNRDKGAGFSHFDQSEWIDKPDFPAIFERGKANEGPL
jgi:hypothetical protein